MTEYLFIGSEDKYLKQWDVEEKKCVRIFKGIDSETIYNIQISDNGEFIFVATTDHQLNQYNLSDESLVKNWGEIATDFISVMKISHDGQYLFLGSMDEHIRQYSISDQTQVADIPNENVFFMEYAVRPDGTSYLFTISDGNTLKQWTAHPKLSLYKDWGNPEQESIDDFIISEKLGWQFTSFEGNVKFWDMDTGNMLREIQAHDSAILSMVVDHNGEYLFTDGEDEKVKMWDVQNGSLTKNWNEENPEGFSIEESLAISTDNKYLYTAAECGKIKIWDIEDKKLVGELDEINGAWMGLKALKL